MVTKGLISIKTAATQHIDQNSLWSEHHNYSKMKILASISVAIAFVSAGPATFPVPSPYRSVFSM